MILYILISLIAIPLIYLIPFLATVLSKDNADKWVTYWLLLFASSWSIIPLFGLYFEEEALLTFKILIALALIFVLNRDKVAKINTSVEQIVGVVLEQKKNAQNRAGDVAKQYGLIQ